ncbi:YbaN family protein [Ruminococcaceae bacterium OttesenSCG-928-I18]|nr:YbaN family protein [Ruminococcaceae bacterium OttesenSCG-928-I18]
MKRVILLSAGFGVLLLGGIGIALPVLPTTPFVLCAAGCFATASPRLYQWLEHTRYFGEYITNYRNKTGVSKRAKIIGITTLWVMLTLSALLSARLWVALFLLVVGVAVTMHIGMLKVRNR